MKRFRVFQNIPALRSVSKQSGFTLVEVVIGAGMMLALLAAGTQVVSSLTARRKLGDSRIGQDRILSAIESNLRLSNSLQRMVRDPRNPELKSCAFPLAWGDYCAEVDIQTGAKLDHPVVVLDFATAAPLSGPPSSPAYYDRLGNPCVLALQDCALQVTSVFQADCPPAPFTNRHEMCKGADRLTFKITIGPVPGSGIALSEVSRTITLPRGSVFPVACPGGRFMQGYKSNGNPECNAWTIEFEGPSSYTEDREHYYGPGSVNDSTRIQFDSQRNLVIHGTTDGWFSLDSPYYKAHAADRSGYYSYQGYVARFSQNLKPLSAVQFFPDGLTASYVGHRLGGGVLDASDNALVTVKQWNACRNPPAYSCTFPVGTRLSSCCGDDALIKVDKNGVRLWEKTIYNDPVGKIWTESQPGIVLDAAGNIFTAATFANCSGSSCAPAGQLWTLFAKYDPDGNKIWEKPFGPAGARARLIRLIGASDGAYFLCSVTGPVSTDGSIGNMAYGKINADGTVPWVRQTTLSTLGSAVTDPAGNLLMSWRLWFGTAAILKVDSNGNQVWRQDRTGVDGLIISAQYASGNILAAGRVRPSSVGFLAKLDPATGNQVAWREFGSTLTDTMTIEDVAVEPVSGKIWVVGKYADWPGFYPGYQPLQLMRFDPDLR